MISKSVSRVESRVREERVQRNLTRSVDRTHHEIDNSTPAHVRGVYRWVDRVDRYQVRGASGEHVVVDTAGFSGCRSHGQARAAPDKGHGFLHLISIGVPRPPEPAGGALLPVRRPP